MESFEKRSVLINIREKQASQQKHEENIGISMIHKYIKLQFKHVLS